MAKEKLIPFIIRNCDEGNFRDMWWYDEPGVVCFDWTRQGNAGWQPPEVAIEWARQKCNLRDKQPRDLKAGLRNALDKKKELMKCKFSKEIEERDGRKFKFWKFKDLESERKNIKNPPSKGGQKKKTIHQKDLRSLKHFEENHPYCSSTSDFKDRYQKSQKTLAKDKDSGKRGGRKKLAYAKHIENVKYKQGPKHLQKDEQESACSLPSITSVFGGKVQGLSQLPLQSQTISSTYNENWFPYTSECGPSTSQQMTFFTSGPTPPPQPNDVELSVEDLNFETPHSSTQQLCSSQYNNYTCHIGYQESQAEIQNIPQKSYDNLMAIPSFHQSPFTTNIAYSNSNLQDMNECYSSVQENETYISDILTDKIANTEILQLQEVMNTEFPTNGADSQLFEFLNALQFDDSITDVYSC